jgi:hypothetical protein
MKESNSVYMTMAFAGVALFSIFIVLLIKPKEEKSATGSG